jgi:hypothetical protein
MIRSLLAGAAYFAIVFAAAFALGTVRVLYVVPAVGDVWGTLLEAPFTLAISWLVSAWLLGRLGAFSLTQAIGMGASAFALLMAAEVAMAILLFGRTLTQHFGSYANAAGALGLAGQIAFGLFPIVQTMGESRSTAPPTATG